MGTQPQDIRNIAVVGHKGAGKTALIEAMLYVAGVVPKTGAPGDRQGGLDAMPEEKDHTATFESRLLTFTWAGKKINIIDTPGDSSFYTDALYAMAAVDLALLVVSAKDGVESGTERISKWLLDRKVPCMVVLSKVDDPNAKAEEALEEVRKLKEPVELMEVLHHKGAAVDGVVTLEDLHAWLGKPESPQSHDGANVPADMAEEVKKARQKLVDDVAATDDTLTEHYLQDGDLSQKELEDGTRKAVAAAKLVPVYAASAVVPVGITAILDAMVAIGPSPLDRPAWGATVPGSTETVKRACKADDPMSAFVFKTHIDQHAGKISMVRVVSGTMHVDAHILVADEGHKDRASQILQGIGKDAKALPEAVAGDMVMLTKMKYARTGHTLTEEKHPVVLELPRKPEALFNRALIAEKAAEDKIAQVLSRLSEEDPGLAYAHVERSRELVIMGLGATHLDITIERIRRRSGMECKLGPPRIAYRETISRAVKTVEGKLKKQSGGHGQFAVCYIDIEPMPRGSGFVFEDAVVGGSVPRQFIPSVEKGVQKALVNGVIAGYPVVDLKVRLTDGKFHSVDSSDAAFQVAGSRAFKQAFAQAGPSILEPVAKLHVSMPSDMLGAVIGDLNSRHGKVLSTDGGEDGAAVEAYVPLANLGDYEPVLTALTHGKGKFSFAFDHYDRCDALVQEKVVRESGFQPQADED